MLKRSNVHIQCMYRCVCIHICAPCMYVCTNTYTAGAATYRPLSPSPSQHTKHTTCSIQHTVLCPLNPHNTRCNIGYRVNSNLHASSWWWQKMNHWDESSRRKMNHLDDAKREIIEIPSVLASGWIIQISVLSVLGSSSFMTMNHRDSCFRPVCCSVLESSRNIVSHFFLSIPLIFPEKTPRSMPRCCCWWCVCAGVRWPVLIYLDARWCVLMYATAYNIQHTSYN